MRKQMSGLAHDCSLLLQTQTFAVVFTLLLQICAGLGLLCVFILTLMCFVSFVVYLYTVRNSYRGPDMS